MKRIKSVPAIILAIILAIASGFFIGLCVVSMITPEPIRTQQEYLDETAVVFVLLIAIAFITMSFFAAFSIEDDAVEVTDVELTKQIKEKAIELLESAASK